MKFYLGMLAILASLITPQTHAEEKDDQPFTIGWALQPTTLNPFPVEGLTSNNTLTRHIFEPLYTLDRKGHAIPLLVSEHVVEDPHTWRFTLKPEDNYYRQRLGEGLLFTIIDNQQFRIHTAKPEPDLLRHLTRVPIVASKVLKTAPEALTPEQLIGTGPYRLLSHQQLKHFQFAAFDNYHGQLPYQQSVTAVVETNHNKLIAGFADKRFDLIDHVRVTDIDQIQSKRPKISVSFPTGTLLYKLHLNVQDRSFADIRDLEGRQMPTNPLHDQRVRKAISLAIDREQLVQDLFRGKGATATAQLVPPGHPGHMPGLSIPPQNIKTAQKLLQEAGYGRGFQLTLRDKHARRYILDALVPMLADIGIEARVETLSPKAFFPRALAHEFPVSLLAYQGGGDIHFMIKGLLLTGAEGNVSHYSNLALDKRFEQASQEFDPSVRFRDYGYAMELGLQDYALIPLFFFNDGWAVGSGRVFNPATDSHTLAQRVHPDE